MSSGTFPMGTSFSSGNFVPAQNDFKGASEDFLDGLPPTG